MLVFKKSTLDPHGPLSSALKTLNSLGCYEEVAEVKRLLVEWLRFREEAAALREELALRRVELAESRAEARETCRVARQNVMSWRSLALTHQSREDLAQIDRALFENPWLRAV
jgi:hypothetical protein